MTLFRFIFCTLSGFHRARCSNDSFLHGRPSYGFVSLYYRSIFILV